MATGARRDIGKCGGTELDLSALAAAHQGGCVSVYMALDPTGSPKGDMAHLHELLRSSQLSSETTAVLLASAPQVFEAQRQPVQERELVQTGARGVALFASEDFFASQRLPAPIPERVEVASNFFVRPLLSFEPANDRFFVLVLSLKHVRLLEGTRRGMHELKLPGIPAMVHQDIEGHSFGKTIEFHSASPAGMGKRGSVFYGSEPDTKERILHFLRAVNESVAKTLKGQHAPLVVASVGYLFPMYKEANTYPALLESEVPGNPDLDSAEVLHASAWKIVEAHLAKTRERALEEYKNFQNTDLTTSNLRKVVLAAAQGRIRFLFLSAEAEQWGSFVPPETVHIHDRREQGDEELLNLAAVLTIRDRGQVYSIPQAEFHEGAQAGALFRF